MHNKKPPLWTFSASFLFGLLFVQHLADKANLILNNFSDRTIGIAVLEGIDIGARSLVYIKSVILLLLISTIFMFVLRFVWRKLGHKRGGEKLKNDSEILYTLSISSIFIIFYSQINNSPLILSIETILNILFLMNLLITLSKAGTSRFDKILYKLTSNYDLVVFSFLFPLIIFFIKWILLKGSFTFSDEYLKAYCFLWVLYWIALRLFFGLTSKNKCQIHLISLKKAFALAAFIPLSVPVSNELAYSLSGLFHTSTYHISSFFLAAILIACFTVLLTNKIKKSKFEFSNSIYLPVFVLTTAVFNQYVSTIHMDGFDTFHHGENLISNQQLFEFGKIPFIDIYPTHGISYLGSQIFYSLINGYSAYSPWLWEWVVKAAEILILYFVLSKLTNRLFSTIVLVFLPIFDIFGGQLFVYGYNTTLLNTYYFVPMIIGLFLSKKINLFTKKNLYTLWFLCIFMLFWRIDFGIASLLSVGFFVFLLLLKSFIKNEDFVYKTKVSLKTFFLSLLSGIFLSTIFAKFDINKVYNTFTNIFTFVRFQSQAQGLLKLGTEYSPIFVLQYLLLPSVAVIYIISFVHQVLTGEEYKKIPGYKTLLFYLSLFSLIIFTRSFQRQTLSVLGYNPYLFVFLILAFPIFFSKRKHPFYQAFFLSLLFIYNLVFPSTKVLAKDTPLISLKEWDNKESRVKVNDDQFKEIVNFLNLNLSKNQTFIDMTSSPLLYVASNRKFVNYLIPNAYWTSEKIQYSVLNNLNTRYRKNLIPIIIMKQPVEAANLIDGVPNEIRSYRIYEYIYTHYRPYGVVDKYEVWASNNFSPKITLINREVNLDQNFDLKKLPAMWARYDPLDSINKTEIIEKIIPKKNILKSNEITYATISNSIDKSKGNYLELDLISKKESIISIYYGDHYQNSFTFTTEAGPEIQKYMIRLSTQYRWYRDNIKILKIESSGNIEISNMLLKKGD